MDKPFKGIKIVDMSSHGACPSCTKILSDWGAEVIKVEAPGGDAARKSGLSFGVPCEGRFNPHFDMLNAGKKSIAVDLKTREGRDILDKLLRNANVFISNFRMPSLVKMHLDYETVHKQYPSIVWAHLSGFGEYGPDSDSAGFDTVAYFARTGAMLDFSEKNTAPVNAPFGVGDLSAGCSLSAGIAAALFRQKTTGEGGKVTISLYGQSLWAHSIVLQGVKHGNLYPKTRREAKVPLNNSYQCSDGEWLYISVLQYERYYPEFCRIIDREDLIDDKRFNTIEAAEENNEEFIGILDEAFKKRPHNEWCRLLKEADIAFDKINHFTEVFNDPQAIANKNFYIKSYGDEKESVIFRPPVVLGEYEGSPVCGAPILSENSAEILEGIGYSKEQIDSLYEKGIVVRPEE